MAVNADLPIVDSDTRTKALLLKQSLADNYSYSFIWFKNNTTLHIGQTRSSNTSRTHFAITSIKGIK